MSYKEIIGLITHQTCNEFVIMNLLHIYFEVMGEYGVNILNNVQQ